MRMLVLSIPGTTHRAGCRAMRRWTATAATRSQDRPGMLSEAPCARSTGCSQCAGTHAVLAAAPRILTASGFTYQRISPPSAEAPRRSSLHRSGTHARAPVEHRPLPSHGIRHSSRGLVRRAPRNTNTAVGGQMSQVHKSAEILIAHVGEEGRAARNRDARTPATPGGSQSRLRSHLPQIVARSRDYGSH